MVYLKVYTFCKMAQFLTWGKGASVRWCCNPNTILGERRARCYPTCMTQQTARWPQEPLTASHGAVLWRQRLLAPLSNAFVNGDQSIFQEGRQATEGTTLP